MRGIIRHIVAAAVIISVSSTASGSANEVFAGIDLSFARRFGEYADMYSESADKRYLRSYAEVVTGKRIAEMTDSELAAFKAEAMPDGKTVNRTRLEETLDVRSKNLIDYSYLRPELDSLQKKYNGKYMSQYDERWRKHRYGSSDIESSGCAPVCIAMAMNIINGNNSFTPAQVADWVNNEHPDYYIPNYGSDWNLISDYCYIYGIAADNRFMYSADDMNRLPEHTPVIASMRQGIFTDGGHFIVIMRDGETFNILDPANIQRSLKKWRAGELLEQMKGSVWIYNKINKGAK